jgi:hypothetical protein
VTKRSGVALSACGVAVAAGLAARGAEFVVIPRL